MLFIVRRNNFFKIATVGIVTLKLASPNYQLKFSILTLNSTRPVKMTGFNFGPQKLFFK